MRSGWSAGRRSAAALAVVVALVAGGSLPAHAQSSSQTANEIAIAQDRLEKLQEEEGQLAEDYVSAIDDLNQLKQDIEKSAAHVAELETDLGELQSAVGELALQAFVSGDQIGGLGQLLTDSGGVTEAVEREQYARLALSAGVSATDQLDAKIHDLELERAALARKQTKAENLIASIEAGQKQLEKKQASVQEYKQALEVKFGKQKLAEEEARRDAERARQTAAAIAASQANRPRNGGGSGAAAPRSGGNPGGGASSGGGSSSGGGGGAGRSVPSPSPGAGGAVAAARSQLGVPYKYAAASPGQAFDCSGLTSWAWGQAGVYLPHQSRQQYNSIPHVDPSEAQPGDLIFSHNPISHVGIYIGGGQMIHAPNSGDVVKISGVNWGRITGVGRPG